MKDTKDYYSIEIVNHSNNQAILVRLRVDEKTIGALLETVRGTVLLADPESTVAFGTLDDDGNDDGYGDYEDDDYEDDELTSITVNVGERSVDFEVTDGGLDSLFTLGWLFSELAKEEGEPPALTVQVSDEIEVTG